MFFAFLSLIAHCINAVCARETACEDKRDKSETHVENLEIRYLCTYKNIKIHIFVISNFIHI